LKCDLTVDYVCQFPNHMDHRGYAQWPPRVNDPEVTAVSAIDFSSSYVLRALHTLPQQGSKTPWRVIQNYLKDLSMLRFGRVDDGTMEVQSVAGESTAAAGLKCGSNWVQSKVETFRVDLSYSSL
jgi:monooxygenase